MGSELIIRNNNAPSLFYQVLPYVLYTMCVHAYVTIIINTIIDQINTVTTLYN